MTATPPDVLVVLLFGCLAAGAAALGALPFAGRRQPGAVWIGAADALSGGAMLGVGYLLMSRGLEQAALSVVLGATLGVGYTHWVRSYAGLDVLDSRPDSEPSPEHGFKVILQSTLHASAEGVAIGVAMALEIGLGIFLALALAVHNIGEAMALTDVLRRRGLTVGQSAGLSVVTNVMQPLMAVVAYAVSPALEGYFPALLGFAAGALVFVTLTESVPASYERADARLVAFLLSTAAGMVVLLQSVFSQGAP